MGAQRVRFALDSRHGADISACRKRAIYHLKGTPAKLVGIIDDAPDEKTAIERATRHLTNLGTWLLVARCGDGQLPFIQQRVQ